MPDHPPCNPSYPVPTLPLLVSARLPPLPAAAAAFPYRAALCCRWPLWLPRPSERRLPASCRRPPPSPGVCRSHPCCSSPSALSTVFLPGLFGKPPLHTSLCGPEPLYPDPEAPGHISGSGSPPGLWLFWPAPSLRPLLCKPSPGSLFSPRPPVPLSRLPGDRHILWTVPAPPEPPGCLPAPPPSP